MIGRNIDRVGVELEGAWLGDCGNHPIHGDGSVHMERLKERRDSKTRIHVGEKSSPAFDSLEQLENWLYKEYPHRRNRTCGFHVNISLTDITLLRRCIKEPIHDAMIQTIIRYAQNQRLGKAFQERLSPHARFSLLKFNPQHKYRAINWSKAISSPYRAMFGDTSYFIEYRIFSQVMPPTKALNGVKFLVELTDLVAESVKLHGENHEVWINKLLKS
jgi:hypothetical protein